VGRLSHQVKPLHKATSLRIIPDIVHLIAKNAWLPWRPPGRQEDYGTNENAMEAPTDFDKPTISSLGLTGHVNLHLDVKVIRS
jgi:hypothetical protein